MEVKIVREEPEKENSDSQSCGWGLHWTIQLDFLARLFSYILYIMLMF
jgi:hypothetical protein